jgi:hypothetical protein
MTDSSLIVRGLLSIDPQEPAVDFFVVLAHRLRWASVLDIL